MNANRIWGIVTALVVVGVLALGWLLGVSPLLAQASSAEQELATVQATNQAQQAVLDEMREKFENIEEYEQQLSELQVPLPGSPDIELLYGSFALAAVLSETHIVAVTTTEPTRYGQSSDGVPIPIENGGTPIASAPTGKLADTLYMIPITIELENKPDETMDFVRALQKMGRYVFVSQISMDGGRSDDPKSTITAYAFFIHAPNLEVDAEELEDAEDSEDSDPAETPDPTGTPVPTESATPTPEG